MDPESLEAGTDPEEGSSGWYWVREAECTDSDSESSQGSEGFEDLAGLIDNREDLSQGNSRALFHQQTLEQDTQQVQAVKRKYTQSSPTGPTEADLSPRLHAITISPPQRTVKRRLRFGQEQDSGVPLSEPDHYETDSSHGGTPRSTQTQVQGEQGGGQPGDGDGAFAGPSAMATQILKSANRQATMHARFKEAYGVAYGELTRQFKSDKTCNGDWVVAVFGASPILYEGTNLRLQKHCESSLLTNTQTAAGAIALMLLRFKAQKSRDTLYKLLKGMLNVPEYQIMAEPPRIRSTPAAVYWFRLAMATSTQKHGELPEWVTRQTMLHHQTAEEQKFTLSTMVQWALDNDYTDECTIAYEYAKCADTDSNAAAWLNTNAQAKHLKDCATMVAHYRRGIMRSLSMSGWIHKRVQRAPDGGDWRHIIQFIKYQHIEVIVFLTALTHLLKGTPKRNCVLLCGPPNTGKSTFAMSLLSFMGGRVLSFANAKSHFWMQPIVDSRLVLIDDATKNTWDYIDEYLRNALDGNPICLDVKHRAPTQLKCPPILVTSNIDIREDDRWRYLHSRVCCFKFINEFPFNREGQPVYELDDKNWKCFFTRLWLQLDLSDQEDEADDGGAGDTFRCGPRGPHEPL
ncbi:E1 [Zalophus californianus papillomavirus 1]|uniref:Replication protein E1 n=1 Tax=Zalophus californianus papillomavirus 1 TaxID=998829 RepID=F2X1C4_9PAPI|nr:E1 [Zalophus californianus papillomavirus 1]ADZ74262.1 E1 [Zalophus californianus papillomavirus 1]